MDTLQLYTDSTTVDLNDGSSYRLMNFSPQYEGGERIVFEVVSGSQAAALIRDIEELLLGARRWRRQGLGERLWLRWEPDVSWVDAVRAEVYNGRLRALDRQSRRWELEIEREVGWRGQLASVGLTNRNGSAVITGLAVENADDASHDNYVEIAAGQVQGDMPALTKIRVQNLNTGARVRCVRMGLRTESSRLVSALLDDAGAFFQLGTTTADSTCNGGNKVVGTVSADTTLAMWRITPASTREYTGLWRAFVRGNFPDTVYLRGSYEASPGSGFPPRPDAVWLVETDEVDGSGGDNQPFSSGSHDLIDLGLIQLPPWPRVKTDTPDTFDLVLQAGGSGSYWWDYVLLLPADEGFRILDYEWGAGYLRYLVDDGPEDEVAAGDSVRANIPHAYGRRMELIPGEDQRIYFSFEDTDGDCDIDFTLKVAVWIEPRYRFFGTL